MNEFNTLITLIISILPIFLIAYMFYKKDTIKEPKKLLNNLFLSGFLSGLIVIIISIIGLIIFPPFKEIENNNSLFILLLYCYIFIASFEEIAKFFMIYKISYNNKEFDQAYDIILYSVFVGLGFAGFENILYALGNNSSIVTAVLRSITAIPAHTCFQALMGYYLYLNKIQKKNNSKNLILSILIPIILHGTYDFLLFSGYSICLIIFLFLLIIIFILAQLKIKKLITIDKNNLPQLCPICNTKINYQYCPNCGYKKNNYC